MGAYKQHVKGVGYVVFWKQDREISPLRNFGDYQSAAIDLCNILNHHIASLKDSERAIDGLIRSYNPDDKYTYPELRNGRLHFRKQRN